MNKISLGFVLATLFISGCTQEVETKSMVNNKVNPCITRGATYTTYTTYVKGTCSRGLFLDEPIKLDAFMVHEIESAQCESAEIYANCSNRATNCVEETNVQGCTMYSSYQTIFDADGSVGNSVVNVHLVCNDGSECSGTYRIDWERQGNK